jgi:DNA repair exonuclease SbcCD nuclease subunit
MRVYALVGNHDMYSKNGTQHALHCISPYATIVSHPMHVEILDSVPISLAPYTESEEVLKQFLKGTAKDSFVFMHQGVANVPMGSGFVVNEILKPDMIPDHISLAFTGHYHAHRQVGNLVVVGAPMQQSYADEGEDM